MKRWKACCGKGALAGAHVVGAHVVGETNAFVHVCLDGRRMGVHVQGCECVHEKSHSTWCVCPLISVFRSCAQVIRPGGTLILELPHPRETFRLEDVTTDG